MKTVFNLKNKTIEVFVDNIGTYGPLIMIITEPCLKRLVFDKAMERIQHLGTKQIWSVLPHFLLGNQTKIFSSNKLARLFGPKIKPSDRIIKMTDLLEFLYLYAPELMDLEIVDPDQSSILRSITSLGPRDVLMICHMEKLTLLNIVDISVRLTGFLYICRKSKSLQKIRADAVSIDVEPKCMKRILNAFKDDFPIQIYFHMEIDKRKIRNIGLHLEKETINAEEARILHYSPKYIPNFDIYEALPEFTALSIEFFSYTEKGVLRPTKKQSKVLMHILEKSGKNLKSLSLYGLMKKANVTFNQIFECCRNLEYLILDDSYVHGFRKTRHFIDQLRKFKWRNQ
ncbi:Hypothetical predicted protein [Cloeon dipterum]|uniref:Uncharacterized protein n=1 Tax=Cloeon dipterum TaxID=197152 RepID=A0A8S1CLL6_9INSE|nr:Hypothetical predicted protein [Cloeon dipterum]